MKYQIYTSRKDFREEGEEYICIKCYLEDGPDPTIQCDEVKGYNSAKIKHSSIIIVIL